MPCILKFIQYLRNSAFARNMSIIMSGTAIAQIIAFALTPIISRLFDASDFGLFGSFNAVIGVLAAGVTLQYSQAVMLPKSEEDAVSVFGASMLSVFGITLACLIFAFVFSDWLLNLLKAPTCRWLLWALPLGVLISGINQSFQAWCVRRKAFTKTAASQVIRVTSANILQIISSAFQSGGGGLIAGAVVADGIASINLSRQIFGPDRKMFREALNWKHIIQKAVEYRDFPIYSTSQNVMNALSQGLPVLLLAHFYTNASAGAYAFGLRLLNVPMGFILTALRQVLFQKASETYNNGLSLLPLFIKLTTGLFAMALVPTAVLFVWAPEIFSWLFGGEWYEAGIFARWLTLWMLIAFCNAPANLIARILRQQRNLFFYECLIVLSRTGVLFVGGYYWTVLKTVIVFSLLGSILNFVLILWIGALLFKQRKNFVP